MSGIGNDDPASRWADDQIDIESLRIKILQFRDARDWKQFHSLKNLVSALAVESSELLELTQWKSAEELEKAPNFL